MSTIVYGILWVLCRAFAKVFFRFQVEGSQFLPLKGGVLIASNHASYTDIPLLGCGVKRRLYYLGRSNLFPNRMLGWLLRSLGWIPLRPGRVDRKAFGDAVSLLKAGKSVVIFPEGSRTETGHLQEGKPGIGMIVAEARCPVLPVYLSGTFNVLPPGAKWIRFHPVRVILGEPLEFSEDLEKFEGKELYNHINRKVMARIADLSRVGRSEESHSLT